MKKPTLNALGKARAAHHRRLAAHPNAIGTAIGFKRKAGVTTGTPAVIVYVREKMPLDSLEPEACIPRTIVQDGKRIATDVFHMGALQYQFGPPPWFCRDRVDNQGTVTTLCGASTGEVFALTCAHCIGGEDRDPSTPGAVALWDPDRRAYLPIGASGAYAMTNGLGIPGNFGFSDWGLFSVQDQEIANRARSSPPLPAAPPTIGIAVSAQTAHGHLVGLVEQMQIQISSFFVDVAIHVTQGATFPGDSGTLWRDQTGRGIAVHALGISGPSGSPMSFAMPISRIAADLAAGGVQLLAS